MPNHAQICSIIAKQYRRIATTMYYWYNYVLLVTMYYYYVVFDGRLLVKSSVAGLRIVP